MCCEMGHGVSGVSLERAVPAGCHRVLWCANTPPATLLPGQECWAVVSVLGWAGQQFPEVPRQRPLVKHPGVQVHPVHGIKQLRSFHTNKNPHQGYN